MISAIIVILALFLLYVLSTLCRRPRPETQKLHGWHYAHRGLHGKGVAENSMGAFQRAVEAGYGVELDVHLLSDGNLAVIHDSLLLRVTGRQGAVEQLTVAQLAAYPLSGTTDTIPEFGQVLSLVDGRVPLLIELKTANNHKALCQAVCKCLDSYKGVYCIQSFDPRCLYWLRRHRPDVIRGQLSQHHNSRSFPWIWGGIMSWQMLNFLTLPDFVAHRHDQRNFGTWLTQKLWRATMFGWTVRTPGDHKRLMDDGWISIFENFRP